MKTLLLGLENNVEFIAAAEGHLMVGIWTNRQFVDRQSAESLRDFLLQHYPLEAAPDPREGASHG